MNFEKTSEDTQLAVFCRCRGVWKPFKKAESAEEPLVRIRSVLEMNDERDIKDEVSGEIERIRFPSRFC
jgi:hypothetical protein